MSTTLPDRTAELTAQELLVLPAFDHTTAWRLGSAIVTHAHATGLSLIVDVRRPGLVMFRAATNGTTAENEAWLDRKAATTLHYETSTALLGARFAAQGIDAESSSWFDGSRHTTAAGSVPVRVSGVGVVAAVTVSGLTSDEDHDLAVWGLTRLVDGDLS